MVDVLLFKRAVFWNIEYQERIYERAEGASAPELSEKNVLSPIQI